MSGAATLTFWLTVRLLTAVKATPLLEVHIISYVPCKLTQFI